MKEERFALWRQRSEIRKKMHLKIIEVKQQRPGTSLGALKFQGMFEALKIESKVRKNNFIINNNYNQQQKKVQPISKPVINNFYSPDWPAPNTKQNG